jgi:hypothetical protein
MKLERLEPRWTLSGTAVAEATLALASTTEQPLVVDVGRLEAGNNDQWLSVNTGSQAIGPTPLPNTRDAATAGGSELTQSFNTADSNPQTPLASAGDEFSPSGFGPVAARIPGGVPNSTEAGDTRSWSPGPQQTANAEDNGEHRGSHAATTFSMQSAMAADWLATWGPFAWRPQEAPPPWAMQALFTNLTSPLTAAAAANRGTSVLPSITLMQSIASADSVMMATPATTASPLPSVDAIAVETPLDPLHLDNPGVKDGSPYLTRTAVTPELALSEELGSEAGVSSDMAQIERVPYSATEEAAASGETAFLDIAASDASVQKANQPSAAEVRTVVSREEMALDHVMAQAYVFTLNGTEALPAEALDAPITRPALPSPAVPQDRGVQDTGDRSAARTEPRRAGVDAVAVLAMMAGQILLQRQQQDDAPQPGLARIV